MNDQYPQTAQRRRTAAGPRRASLRASLWCLAAYLSIAAQSAPANGLSGSFEVRSADLELEGGVYHLNAEFDLPTGEEVKRGLADGVPLTLEVDLVVERVRHLWPNSDIATLTQRYQLQYNTVSARYVLRNDNSGQQQSFPTVDAALANLAAVRGVPVLDKSLLPAGRPYVANVRAKMDYGSVPLTLRVLMFWVNEWHRESDWYTWTLPP